jgi:hypothetical protein
MNSFEYALFLQEQLIKYKTQSRLAAALSLQESKVSRYLKIFTLADPIQEQLKNGEISMTKALASVGKNKLKVTPINQIAKSGILILDIIEKYDFVTLKQLTSFTGLSYSLIVKQITKLENAKKVAVHRGNSPYAIRLSYSYASKIKATSKRWKSGYAIHQILLRNDILLSMQERNKSIKFINRLKLWNIGYYPSKGEYCISYQNPKNDNKELALVIIDDYQMSPVRPIRSLHRLHRPHKAFYKGIRLKWIDNVNLLIIYTTDEAQALKFRRALTKYPIPINSTVRVIAPIWELY